MRPPPEAQTPSVLGRVAGPAVARVLVVDDDADLLRLYARVLEDEGYEVVTADGGASAQRCLEKDPFDVVLTDIRMPETDGLALMRCARMHDLDVPVILNTARPEVDSAIQAVNCGALSYLVKPVPDRVLVAAIARAARLHRLAVLKREAASLVGSDAGLLGDRASLEARLAAAVGRLWLAYQPIVRAEDGCLFGHEALMRSDEPTLRGPLALLDAAERIDGVRLVGRAVRAAVAADLEAGRVGTVFVNVHAAELLDPELPGPLAPFAQRVILEVTERASLSSVAQVQARACQLREAGFRLALDDLGAGYAGLTSLTALEPEIVKLDAELIRAIHAEPRKQRIVASIVGLCREMGALVVAEGIESDRELRAAVDLGCTLLQGYHLGEPRPILETAQSGC